MRNLLPGVCLLLLPFLSPAQVHHLVLPAQPLNVPANSFYITRIVDARPDRSRLGAVYLGLDNRLVSADFAQPLEAEVLALLQRQHPAPGPSARPVVLRIHALSLAETIRTTSETGLAELRADVLIARAPGAYYHLLSVGELLEERGTDVTRQHPQRLAQVLQRALSQLAALPAEAPGSGPALSAADVDAGRGGLLTQRYPVQTEPLQQGVYASFAEFRANRPTGGQGQPFTLAPVKRKGGLPAMEATYLYLSRDQPARPVRGEAWGVSDGRTAYIFQEGAYYPLQADSLTGTYSFTRPAPADPQELTMGAVLGGVAGLALAGALSGGEPLPCQVHLATGRVEAAPSRALAGSGAATPADSATIYLYRRPDARPEQTLTLRVEGQPVATLLPGQYRVVRWADRRRELSLCVQGPAGEPDACHRFVPDFAAPTFLQATLGDEPGLQPVPAKEGQFYVKLFRRPPARPRPAPAQRGPIPKNPAAE